MMIPAADPRDVVEVVVRYWYQGRPWRLRFDMNAPDPLTSIYFDEAEAATAREAIGEREERHAPLGEEWVWEEQGVTNELDDSVAIEGESVRQESQDGEKMTSRALYATAPDEDGTRAEVTTCWHHMSCLWSCLT
ncbi:MAG: hypothetical protein WEB88_06235 [Gemmatimonadota bacterium]